MMDTSTEIDVHLPAQNLKGRTFLLGNKRAFALSLPAASGPSDALLHGHKWYGAYLYGRKYLEGQVVRAYGARERMLSYRQQVGFTMGLTSARREYMVEEQPISEEFFVPDGVQGFACTLTGDVAFTVEPELDMRFYLTLNHSTETYEVEEIDGGVLVSNPLPSGTYDDASETFHADGLSEGTGRLYAAIAVVGEGTWAELLDARYRSRRKVFRKDFQRHRFLTRSAPDDAVYDHAPLWNQSSSRVYAPVRLHVSGYGTIVYGFGASREEALNQLNALKENLVAYQAQKYEAAATLLDHARFSTGMSSVDTAYAQVLTRLMDGLVARHAVAEDTALERPATMIMAGNQYFHDSWKRDENIALGFLLSLGFYDLARDVIRDTWRLQDPVTGRLPQRIRAGEEPPYHSSDGTLWALLRLYQYWRCTGDEALLYEKLPMVKLFFRRGIERSRDGMLPSGRTTAPDYLWETWMDTPHTPRDGFPIEIQMLWIACLRNFRPLLRGSDPDLEADMAVAEASARIALLRFNVRGVPADSLDDQGEVRDLITPNAYFCFGLGLDLDPVVERSMRDMGRRQLAGRQGIRTLAPQDWGRVFSPEFLSDPRKVRGRRMRSIGKFNYHRGVEWNWLTQFFVQAELKFGEPSVAYQKYVNRQVEAALCSAGIGGISELFDLSGTRGPEFQAWSMSGFLEALHHFAGVRIDVPERRITIEPQLPRQWPHLAVRKWYGNTPFDVVCRREGESLVVEVEFPWGEPPEAELEMCLLLPGRRTLGAIEVQQDGKAVDACWTVESTASAHERVRCLLPVGQRVSVELTTRKRTRAALTA